MIYTCPDKPRFFSDLVGCGASFDAMPDNEGLIDCPECGMFFRVDDDEPDAIANRMPLKSTQV